MIKLVWINIFKVYKAIQRRPSRTRRTCRVSAIKSWPLTDYNQMSAGRVSGLRVDTPVETSIPRLHVGYRQSVPSVTFRDTGLPGERSSYRVSVKDDIRFIGEVFNNPY